MEIVTGSAVAFFALFLVDIQGFTLGAATMWIGLLRGGAIVGGLLGGYFADRWGLRQAGRSRICCRGLEHRPTHNDRKDSDL